MYILYSVNTQQRVMPNHRTHFCITQEASKSIVVTSSEHSTVVFQ